MAGSLPGVKRGPYNPKPTEKQQKAINIYLKENVSKSEAMRRAGYTERTVRNNKAVFKGSSVKSVQSKLLKKYNLTLDRAYSILNEAAQAKKVIKTEAGDYEAVPDHTMRVKAADRIIAIIDTRDQKGNDDNLHASTPSLTNAIKSGDEIELQRIVFNKTSDESETVKLK